MTLEIKIFYNDNKIKPSGRYNHYKYIPSNKVDEAKTDRIEGGKYININS